jgi:hypothetical protein
MAFSTSACTRERRSAASASPAQPLGHLALGDVVEDEGEPAPRLDRRREDVEAATHRLRALLEADGLAAERHATVGLHPPRLEAGHELERRAADRAVQPGHRLELRIGLQEAVVHRAPVGVQDHLAEAVALVDRENSARNRASLSCSCSARSAPGPAPPRGPGGGGPSGVMSVAVTSTPIGRSPCSSGASTPR